MILTAAQVSAFERAIASSNNVLPKIEILERLGTINPPLAERARQLRTKRDYLYQLSEAALEFNAQVPARG